MYGFVVNLKDVAVIQQENVQNLLIYVHHLTTHVTVTDYTQGHDLEKFLVEIDD